MTSLYTMLIDALTRNEFFEGFFLTGAITYGGYLFKVSIFWLWTRIDRLIRYSAYFDEMSPMYNAFVCWYEANHEDKHRNVEYKLWNTGEGDGNQYEMTRMQYEDENFFVYNRKTLFISKQREQIDNASAKHDRFLNMYKVTGFFAKKHIEALMEECHRFYENSQKEKREIRLHYNTGFGQRVRPLGVVKTFDDLFFKRKNELIKDIDRFFAKRGLYALKKIPHKRGYFFYGPPGTGKTSIAYAMAVYLHMDIVVVNLSTFKNDSELIDFFANLTGRNILLFEDIHYVFDDNCKINMSTVLNCFSGAYAPPNSIYVVTTNHPDKIDKALLRTDRLDYKMKVDLPSKVEVEQFVSKFYGIETRIPNYGLEVPMSDIEDFCLRNYPNHDIIQQISTQVAA